MGAHKTASGPRCGRRKVPIAHAIVLALREHLADSEWPRDDDLVFCTRTGRPYDYSNLHAAALCPAREEAGVPWAGFHTLRHTCATRLFAEGRNAVQVQRWLGHHSPAFTLNVYMHLLDADLGAALGEPVGPAGASKRQRNQPKWGRGCRAGTPIGTGIRQRGRARPSLRGSVGFRG